MIALHDAALLDRWPLCYAGRHPLGNFPLRGDVIDQPPAGVRDIFHQLGPVLTAAVMFTVSDVLAKLALEGGTDVLSLLSFRSILGIALVYVWLRLGEPAVALSRNEKWI